jgi:membrane fusion protein (multidrug efflux system)
MNLSQKILSYILPSLLPLTLYSCGGSGATVSKTAAKTFTTMKLAPRQAQIIADYPASILGIQNIEIRPKIDGCIENIYVDKGASVKQGQLLFSINASQYEQNVATAEANLYGKPKISSTCY